VSLVNDMLIALERRDALTAPEDGGDYYQDLDASTSTLTHPLQKWWLLALFVLVAVGLFSYWLPTPTKSPQPIIAPTSIAIPVPEKQLPSTAQVLPRDLPQEKPVLADTIESEETKPELTETLLPVISSNMTALEYRIAQLLHEAELALLNNRLTDPVNDNAYARYQSILLLDPTHAEALAGIQTVVARYLEFSHQTHALYETTKAKSDW